MEQAVEGHLLRIVLHQTVGDNGAELKQGYHDEEVKRGETGEARMTLQW